MRNIKLCGTIRTYAKYSGDIPVVRADKVYHIPKNVEITVVVTNPRAYFLNRRGPYPTDIGASNFLSELAPSLWESVLSSMDLEVLYKEQPLCRWTVEKIYADETQNSVLVTYETKLYPVVPKITDANDKSYLLPRIIIDGHVLGWLPRIPIRVEKRTAPRVIFPNHIEDSQWFTILADNGVLTGGILKESCNGNPEITLRLYGAGSRMYGRTQRCEIVPPKLRILEAGVQPVSKNYKIVLKSAEFNISVNVMDEFGYRYTYTKVYNSEDVLEVNIQNLQVELRENKSYVHGSIEVRGNDEFRLDTSCSLQIDRHREENKTTFFMKGSTDGCKIYVEIPYDWDWRPVVEIRIPSPEQLRDDLLSQVGDRIPRTETWNMNVTEEFKSAGYDIHLAKIRGERRITDVSCVTRPYSREELISLWKKGKYPVFVRKQGDCYLYIYLPVQLTIVDSTYSPLEVEAENGRYAVYYNGMELYRSETATGALQFALDHIADGGTVTIGAGRYILDTKTPEVIRGEISAKKCWIYSSLQIYGKRNVTIRGAGPEKTVLVLSKNVQLPLGPYDRYNTYTMIYAREYNGLRIEGVTLDGSGDEQTMDYHDGMALLLTGGPREDLELRHIRVQNSAWDGIYLGYNSNGWERKAEVEDINFHKIRHDALVIDAAEDSTFRKINIHDNPRLAVFIEGAPPGKRGNIVISDLFVENGIVYHTVLDGVTIRNATVVWHGNREGYGAITAGNAAYGQLNIINTNIISDSVGIYAHPGVSMFLKGSSVSAGTGITIMGYCDRRNRLNVKDGKIQANIGIYARGADIKLDNTLIQASVSEIYGIGCTHVERN